MPYQERTALRGQPGEYSPSSSGATTPTNPSVSSSAFLSNPITGLASGLGGLVRRFSDMTTTQPGHQVSHKDHSQNPGSASHSSPLSHPNHHNNGMTGVYTPPIHRSASPMRPPPLEPLELRGFKEDTKERARLLTPVVAEEIRIMVPERQRIEDQWNLIYSLDQDGASLGTLYKKCSAYVGTRSSFVLVVRDNDGGVSADTCVTLLAALENCETNTAATLSARSSSAPTSLIHHTHQLTTSATANASSGGHPS